MFLEQLRTTFKNHLYKKCIPGWLEVGLKKKSDGSLASNLPLDTALDRENKSAILFEKNLFDYKIYWIESTLPVGWIASCAWKALHFLLLFGL